MSNPVRRACSSALIACVLGMGSATAAQASDTTIAATVKSDVPKILRSQAKILDGLATLRSSHSVTPLIRAIKAQDRNLNALRRTVSADSASSTAGTQGQADIVKGLQLIVRSNTVLDRAIAKEASGATVAKSQLRKAVSAAKRGNVDVNTGGKLLGV